MTDQATPQTVPQQINLSPRLAASHSALMLRFRAAQESLNAFVDGVAGSCGIDAQLYYFDHDRACFLLRTPTAAEPVPVVDVPEAEPPSALDKKSTRSRKKSK